MNIGSRIDKAMRIANIKNQAELSRLSGVPESTIARILKIGGNPSIDTLAALAKTLKVSIDWMATGGTTSKDDIPDKLVYLSNEELRLITQFREATQLGKSLIITSGDAAPKRPPAISTDSDQP